ncbi:MAG: putative metal-dependent hydrolase [Cytophagales bacterium]|jgi:predicted metal-dependent hydrolase|nr:M48 family metallopeptidase [Bacteroidota bacterium]WHZ06832.1 MAG: putative metal-dependent hydrolase [Cytophagales bacterium]
MEVGNINIEIVRKRIKNIHLAVYPPHGRVRLATPMDVEEEAIKLFAISKLPWIRKQQRKLIHQDRQSSRKYIDRESHYFQGRRFLLRVMEGQWKQRVEIKSRTYIDLYVHPKSTVEQRESVMNAWYRKQLKEQIALLMNEWQSKIGVSVDAWSVKQMKTKWGTCNTESQKILFNLELAKKPDRCVEYIIVHELVHLLERKHNDRFLAWMNKFMPQWRTRREELNQLPVSHVDWEY